MSKNVVSLHQNTAEDIIEFYRMKAFLLAAGLGTRLKPFTDSHPKALAMVNGQSLLERNIRFLQKFDIWDVVVNIHHFAEQIIRTIEDNNGFGSRVILSDESDAVLETGGGLKKAAPLLRDVNPILMMNVDILSDINIHKMRESHLASGALATLAVQKRQTSRALLFDDQHRLCGWEHLQTGVKKIPVNLSWKHLNAFAFSGIQILSQNFLSKIHREGKFSIIDTYLDLCATEKIIGWEHSDDFWLDVGKPENLQKAQDIFR